MDFTEAYEIVNVLNSEYDYCTEYPDAFSFSKHDEKSFGGMNSPAVVMKDDGQCINFVAYIDAGHGNVIREGYITDWLKGANE